MNHARHIARCEGVLFKTLFLYRVALPLPSIMKFQKSLTMKALAFRLSATGVNIMLLKLWSSFNIPYT